MMKNKCVIAEGEKVYLRKTVESDLKYFAEWEVIPEVTAYFTMSKGRNLEEIKAEVDGRADDPSELDTTICMKEDDRVIGRIYFSAINDHYDSADITRIYIGDTSIRGLGLGEDALKCAMKYCFDGLNCERVTLDHVPENVRAANLYHKVGFKDEGTMRHGGKKDGYYVDLMLMSILKDEYYALYPKKD